MKSMRTLFLLSVNLLFTTVMILHAQDKMPQAVSYQAVARDAQGKVVAQKAIGIQVEILKGSTTGAVVFSETHFPTSSQTGTVNLLIGNENFIGDDNAINVHIGNLRKKFANVNPEEKYIQTVWGLGFKMQG